MPSDLITGVEVPERFKRKFQIPGRMADLRDPMFDLAPDPCRVAVEIGSQWGWWTHRAVKQLPGCKVFCIDPWSDDLSDVRYYKGGSKNMIEWALNVEPWLGDRVFAIRGKSIDIADMFDLDVDFLFIDGDHLEDSVYDDMVLWIPKVRNGGVIVGHDWDGPWSSGVRRAVRRYLSTHGVEPQSFGTGKVYWSYRGKELSNCWVIKR